MEKNDTFETEENKSTENNVSNTQDLKTEDIGKKPERVFVKPIKKENVVNKTANEQALKPIVQQDKTEPSSIISMCDNLKLNASLDSQPNIKTLLEQLETEPKRKRKKSYKKVMAAVCIVLLFFATASGVGLMGMSMYNQDNNSQDNNSELTENTTMSDDATVDIVTNVASDASIDQIQSGTLLTVPQIYEKVSPSTVGIQADTLAGASSVGTGIIMSESGYIITNNHVIEGADILTVALYDGSLYNAEIIGADSTTDLAVIKITPEDNNTLIVAEFGDSDTAVVGDIAITIGNPGGLELQGTLTGGYISAINRDMLIEDRIMTLIQTDAAINPGNSGGPLINEYGQVIGINTIKISAESYEGLGFAIPINDAKPIIDELIAFGYVTGRPSIGISGYDISAEQAVYNNIPQGLLVKSVDTRADAYTKGLKVNDIIVGVNGQTTTSVTEINAIKETFKAGDYITLNVYRGGQYFEIEIMLMDEVDLQSTTVTEEVPQTDSYSDYYGGNGNFSFNFPFGN